MATQSTIIKYDTANSFGSFGQSPYKKKARLDSIGNFTYTDKLNKLTDLKFTVPNNEYTRANAFVERDAYFPLITPFKGMVVDFAQDKSEISLMAEEKATHFKRRIYRHDGSPEVNFTDKDWYDKQWMHRRKLSISNKLVSGTIKSFTIKVGLTNDDSLKLAQSTGNDILFTEKDGKTKIPHEIEKFDHSTGTLVAWVRLPKISDSSNTTFYMYFNNPINAVSQQDAANVWIELYEFTDSTGTTSYNYDSIWHLSGDSTDSVGSNDGTDSDVTYVDSKIGQGIECNGSSTEINCGTDASIDNIFSGTGGWIRAWFKPRSDGENDVGAIMTKFVSGVGWKLRTTAEANGLINVEFTHSFTTNDGVWSLTTKIDMHKWHRVDIVYDRDALGNDPIFYIDGEKFEVTSGVTETTTPTGSTESDATAEFFIGNVQTTGADAFDGFIDEVRVMITIPIELDNVIKTEYENESNDDFLIIGPIDHYKEPAAFIAQDIVDSANKDMPIISSLDLAAPVSLWRFNGDVEDSSSTNTGTWAGNEKYTDGYYALDKALDLDGSSRVTFNDLPFDFDQSNSFVIAFAINSGDNGSEGVIVSKMNTNDSQGYAVSLTSAGAIRVRLINTNTTNEIDVSTSGVNLEDSNWHYVIVSYDGSGDASGISVRINGVEASTSTTTNNLVSSILNNVNLTVGGYADNSGLLTAKVDDVRIYKDVTFTNDQKDALYRATQSDLTSITRRIKWKLNTEDVVVVDNLLSLWELDKDLKDSASENHGTLIGSENFVEDSVFRQAFKFDGSTRIEIDNPNVFGFEHSDAFTVDFRIKFSTNQTAVIVGKTDNAASVSDGWAIMLNSGTTKPKILFRLHNGDANHDVETTEGDMDFDTWYHITCVYDGTSNRDGMDIFIDAVLKQSGTSLAITSTITNSHPLTFGAEYDGGQPLSNVILDDIRVYNTNLSQVSISALDGQKNSGLHDIRSDDFPSDIVNVSFTWKNHLEALDAVALSVATDLWFDNEQFIVNMGTKGKEIKAELDLIVTTKPEKKLENFANIINMIGKNPESGGALNVESTTDTVQRYNYERVVSNSQTKLPEQLEAVGGSLLKQFQEFSPQIKGRIPYEQFVRFDLQSGDTIKVVQPDQGINGMFRVMDIKATRNQVELNLESTESGIIRHRSNSLTDVMDSMLKKLNDISVESS